MDDRRLTLIVVPHGDLETRTFEIPYRKLRIGIYIGVGLLLLIGFVVATWIPILAQAGRVPALLGELHRLEAEREQVAELAKTLAEVEAQYERVRQLLGADGAGSDAPTLPPLGKDSAAHVRRPAGGPDEEELPPMAVRESRLEPTLRKSGGAVDPLLYTKQMNRGQQVSRD
jgi:hypothetical protein